MIGYFRSGQASLFGQSLAVQRYFEVLIQSGAVQYVPLLLVAWLLCGSNQAFCQGGPAMEMDDIDYWVGVGNNRSALVVDWTDNSAADPALVWGYRWDGNATGAEMITAIVTADRRLFARVNPPAGSSTVLYGLGYDATGDQQFALDDGTEFDAAGFAVTGPADLAVSVDSEDFYAEGWFTGLWHYGVSDPELSSSNPYAGGTWISAPSGVASRLLIDGSWDSWTYTPTFDFEAFAENPHAAQRPITPGDFEPDRDVDGADLLIWQRGFGIRSGATLEQGDANGDGMVDEDDLNLWQASFSLLASTTVPFWAVPVPSTSKLAIFLLCCCSSNLARSSSRYAGGSTARTGHFNG